MTSSTIIEFSKAGKHKAKGKRPAPFCLRLSEDERAALERKAGKQPLGAYIRSQLLDGEEIKPRKKSSRTRKPSVDAALLGQVLGLLGKSDQVSVLFMLALAESQGRVDLNDEDRAVFQDACGDVREVRRLLIKALGLKAEDAP